MKKVEAFLRNSNYIEREYSEEAYEDALDAWEFMQAQDSVTLLNCLEVHRLTMKRLRPDIAGKWRDCDVRIGGVHKRFFSRAVIESELRDVFSTMNGNNYEKGKAEEFAKHLHVLFERVHPFEDGNGRTGRILYNWHRLKLGLPLHVIHEGEEQQKYYNWFK